MRSSHWLPQEWQNKRIAKQTMKSKLSVAMILFLLILANRYSRAAEKYLCFAGNRTAVQQISGVQITVSPWHPAEFPEDERECRLTVRNAMTRDLILKADDHSFSIALTGRDLNGDGIPDVVLQGYSGGNHGTSSYYVISTGDQPGLLLKFESDDVPARFFLNPVSGKMEIHTWDGAFSRLDGLCSACSPYPDIYLEIDGGHLRNISPQHQADYDKVIRRAKKSLPAADFARFKVIDQSWSTAGEEQAASGVVKIAVAYLYSGRESQAHAVIRRMWPAFDQHRIWKLILRTSRRGALRQISHLPSSASPKAENRTGCRSLQATTPGYGLLVLFYYNPLPSSLCTGCSTRKLLPPLDHTRTIALWPLATLLRAF
jgi:hypothetical protein